MKQFCLEPLLFKGELDMNVNTKLVAAALVGFVLLCSGPPARATILVPSPGFAPGAPVALLPGAIIDSLYSGDVTSAIAAKWATPGGDKGTYQAAVYREAGTGDLDFLYQFKDKSGGDTVVRQSAFFFNGFTTDVGYIATGDTFGAKFVGTGTIVPTTVDRHSPAVVGFNFALTAGTTTRVFVIRTNATTYFKDILTSLSDGGTVNLTAFAPLAAAPPVPAPETAGMGLVVLAGLGGFRKARSMYGRGKAESA